MLQPIYLPDNMEIEEQDATTSVFTIYPYYPGYGPTVANALRRVLLSSLPGAAITHVKVQDVDHEFTALPGIKEDGVSILLNLKRVRLTSTSQEPIQIRLQAKGEKQVTAGDFDVPPEVTIANPDQVIATLTDKAAEFDITATIEQGRGYVPAEGEANKERPIGTIALDAVFSPVRRVSFTIENIRVGQATDYHKLLLTIATDGTVSPKEALQQAASVLSDHFAKLTGDFTTKLTDERPQEVVPVEEPTEPAEPENTLNLLQLPSRVHNALERIGVTTVEQVFELTEEQIQDIPGLGAKAVDDIQKARDGYQAAPSAEPKES